MDLKGKIYYSEVAAFTHNYARTLGKYENYIEQVELIKGHKLGDEKYIALSKDAPEKCEVSEDFLKGYKNILISNVNIPVDICMILYCTFVFRSTIFSIA